MKTILWTIATLFIFISTSHAQQVTSVDCCVDVGSKAMIIINDNSANNNATTSPSTPVVVDKNGKCDFKLTVSSNTSAGVYNAADNLIRTLWSGVRYDAGCYSLQWDGLLDDGTQAPMGSYNIKILSNNVKYEWLGVLGNSSTSHASDEFLIGNGVYGMAIANGSCYLAGGYAERDISTTRFAINDIGKSKNVNPGSQTLSAFATCSNSRMVFYAGEDSYQTEPGKVPPKFLYAFNPTTEQQIVFTNGHSYTINIDGRVYPSVLGYSENGSNHILGIAATDNFLFVSRETGAIETYDLRNNSGALLFTTSISGVGRIAVAGSNIWAIVNGVPKQYNIAANGTITSTGLALNLTNASAIKFNSFANEIVAGDLTAQNWKFYDANSGSYKSVVGIPGGYANGPAVTPYKFLFVDFKERLGGKPLPDIAFQDDGSFWLTDIGNYRIMHFGVDHVYKDQVAYVPSSRSCTVDVNNPIRVFADALEYQVDYSKVNTDINSSWTLKYNWSANTALNEFEQFKGVVTLTNGFTYGYGSVGSDVKHLYKLDPTNGAVYLKDIGGNEILEADGSLYDRINNNNTNFLVTKRSLTSGNNVLLNWTDPVIIATTRNIDPDFPFYYINNTRGSATNQNRQFFYNPVYNYDFGNGGYGNHLIAIKNGTNTIEWQASKSTGTKYTGEYPRNGDFATNSPGNAGSRDCLLNINGSDLFTHVNDELGIYTQVARTNHFNEDGLFIGHFGTDNKTVGYTGDTKFWAGNSFKTQLAKVGNDIYYFYCDESKHGGVHIVKVSNLSSIKEQSIQITVNQVITSLIDPYNLMAGLPLYGNSFAGAPGWTSNGNPTIKTTVQQFLPINNDIQVSGNTGDRQVARSLSTKQLSAYTLSGNICYTGSQFTFNDFNVNNYLALVDQSGKQIAIVYGKDSGIYLNSTRIAPYYSADQNLPRSFSFDYLSGVLNFKFGTYPAVKVNSVWDAGADISRPGKMLINQHVINYRGDYTQLSLFGLRFVIN